MTVKKSCNIEFHSSLILFEHLEPTFGVITLDIVTLDVGLKYCFLLILGNVMDFQIYVFS